MDASTHMHVQELVRLVDQSELRRLALVLTRLSDGASAACRSERPLYPASLIKVPLVAAAMLLRERGSVGSGPFTIDVSNLTANDAPSPLVAGYDATLEELCTLAITRSDNVATNQLYDVLG